MKYFLLSALALSSVTSTAQTSLSEYIDFGEPADFKELVETVMKPEYATEIKADKSTLIENFVFKAGHYTDLAEADIKAWNQCMKYLIDLGIPLNGKTEDDVYSTLMYYTSSFNLGFGSDSTTNRHRLHTELLKIGGKTETMIDGVSLLHYVLTSEPKTSSLYKMYLDDFRKWDEVRKSNWLFSIASSEDYYDDEEVSQLFGQLLEQKAFDVNIRSKNGKESLFDAAVRTGKFFTANTLLDNGFNVNQRCFACDGETALHNVVNNEEYCESEETFELIGKMMEKGADADLRDMKGFTPIHYAIKSKCEMAFRAFMEEKVTFNYQLGTLKGKSYHTFFVDEWNDEDFLQILSTKTGLKAPPTKKEIKEAQDKRKEEEAKKKQEAKEKKKDN